MALPRPVVEPPPTATAQSASSRRASSRARARGLDRHVHHRARKHASGARANIAATCSALDRCSGVDSTSARFSAEPLDLGRQLRQRTSAEHHARDRELQFEALWIHAWHARRGGRYPAGAPTVAVDPAGRLRCDARPARSRSETRLHSLRSLRSDNRRESEDEARAARVPTALLRFSPPHKSPTPDTAHRAEALAAFGRACHGVAGKAGGGCASAATYAAPRSARLMAARAQRASASDSPTTVRAERTQ